MHWDFALILLFLAVAVPLLGRRRIRQILQAPETTKAERLALYASTIAFQWLAAALILWRSGAHGISLAGLGLAIPHPALTATVSIGLAALVLVNQIVSLKRLSTQPMDTQDLMPQLALKVFPQDTVERLIFLALAATVALCEEFIYRGFVQRLFEDMSGGLVLVGILSSATMFAFAHLYQGRRGLIATFVVGLLFSIVRAITGSLLAPQIAHFVADLTAGFLAPAKVRAAIARARPAADQSAPEQKVLFP